MSSEIELPVVRCSSLDRIVPCPSSRLMSEIVDERQSDSPLEGIYGHWKIAAELIEKMGASPPAGGLPPPEVPASYTWNESSDWLVYFCYREIKNLIPASWSLEVEVPLAYRFPLRKPYLQRQPDGSSVLVEEFILSGHIDALAVSPDGKSAIGWDWKTGYNPVEPAEYNLQVLGYLALIKRAYPDIERVDFYIVQPRNDEDAGFKRVDSVTLIGDECQNCVYQLGNDVNDSFENETLINSGITQCKYCPVGIQCPVAQHELHRMKMTLTPQMLGRLRGEPNDGVLGDMVVTAKTFANAVDDAVNMLHERLDVNPVLISAHGTRITRKMGVGKYKPIDAPKILAGMLAIAPPHEVAHSINFSTGRMKDLIAKSMGIGKTSKSGQSAQSVFNERFKPLFEQSTTRTLIFS